MRRLTAWAAKNADGVAALVVAAIIVTLDVVSSVPPDTVNNGVLLVLGVLAVAMLRDRARSEAAEKRSEKYLHDSSEVLPALETRTAKLDSMNATVATVARALDNTTMVRVLSGPEVTSVLADARRGTDRWLFRGGTGTYIRAMTLPECVASARRERRALLVRLEIIDPTNEVLCERYAGFRRSLSVDQTDWTTERTQHESYATIVAACWHRQRYDLLDIEVGLSQVMPTLRWDMSARSLIITQEDPRGPALLVDAGKLLYEYTNTDLRKSFEQARRVPIELAREVRLGAQPTIEEIRKLFTGLQMALLSTVTDRDVADIVGRALRAENVYDR